MHSFFQQHIADLRLMADLQGTIDRERLLRMRAQIDRMRSQNMRLAALAMWYAKVNMPAR